MRTFSFKLTASLLALASATVPATADDAKNYPGNLCMASSTANTKIERLAVGRGMNNGPGTTTVSCPAVKDFSSIASAKVFVIDEHPDQNLSCTLRSRNLTGNEDGAETRSTDVDIQPGFHSSLPAQLNFGGMDGNAVGYYFFYCSLPEPFVNSEGTFKSGVITYQITEND